MQIARSVHAKALNFLAHAAYAVRGTRRRWRELACIERLPPDQREQAVTKQLRSLLEHAFANVPYYREIARQRSLKPSDFETCEDLAKLPVLTKHDIRDNYEGLLSASGPSVGVEENHTGGSTGEPLKFVQDRSYREWAWADKARLYERCYYSIGEPLVFLWGSDVDSSEHKGAFQKFCDAVGRNLLWVNTFDLSVDLLERYAHAIAAHAPALIVGYVTSLTMYARYLLSSDAPRPEPRAIQASAEVLTSADRAILEQTFGCPVFDRYGCREVGVIAHECEAHEGLHVSVGNNIVEILDASDQPLSDDVLGRVVVTNLHNYAMPFIRYDVGDLARPAAGVCDCSRTSMRLRDVVGRTSDVIVTPGGRLLHSGFFTRLFYGRDDVKQFQVVQKSLADLHLRLLLTDAADSSAVVRDLTQAIADHADADFEVTVELCDQIPTSESGKYRFIVSQLESPFRARQ